MIDAYESQARRAFPPSGDLSEALHERIAAFHARMTVAPDPDGDGAISATVNSMTDDEVHDAGRELMAIAASLEGELRERDSSAGSDDSRAS